MIKGGLLVCGALLALALGVHEALATPPCSACGVLPHAAPAPLLAAGIPAFVALGGGALIARLRSKRKIRSATAPLA